jgi:competence protein CoiA
MENSHYLKDSNSARCSGLIGGYAICEKTGKTVSCYRVTKKDGPFYCPQCYSTAIIRKCSEKEDHFAHKPKLSPVLTVKDQSLHTECKNSICKYLSEQYPDGKWEVERPIYGNPEKGTKTIIPDISGRIEKIPVAIEVQKSTYTIDKIKDKTEQYYKRGVYVLWIIPLREDLGNDDFRPRLFEKYLHAMYYGRAYYWIPKKPNKILPVHFSFSCRYIEETSFYDENGEEQVFGGYSLPYKTIKKPNSAGFIDIATDFKKAERLRFKNKKWEEEVPACKIMMDTKESWWSKNEKEEMIKNYQYNEDNSYDSYDNYDYDEK